MLLVDTVVRLAYAGVRSFTVRSYTTRSSCSSRFARASVEDLDWVETGLQFRAMFGRRGRVVSRARPGRSTAAAVTRPRYAGRDSPPQRNAARVPTPFWARPYPAPRRADLQGAQPGLSRTRDAAADPTTPAPSPSTSETRSNRGPRWACRESHGRGTSRPEASCRNSFKPRAQPRHLPSVRPGPHLRSVSAGRPPKIRSPDRSPRLRLRTPGAAVPPVWFQCWGSAGSAPLPRLEVWVRRNAGRPDAPVKARQGVVLHRSPAAGGLQDPRSASCFGNCRESQRGRAGHFGETLHLGS